MWRLLLAVFGVFALAFTIGTIDKNDSRWTKKVVQLKKDGATTAYAITADVTIQDDSGGVVDQVQLFQSFGFDGNNNGVKIATVSTRAFARGLSTTASQVVTIQMCNFLDVKNTEVLPSTGAGVQVRSSDASELAATGRMFNLCHNSADGGALDGHSRFDDHVVMNC